MIKNDIQKQINDDYKELIDYIEKIPKDKAKLRSLYHKDIYKSIQDKYKDKYYKPYIDDLREPLSYDAFIVFKTLSGIHISKFRETKFTAIIYLYTILNFASLDRFYEVIKELEDKQYIEFRFSKKGLKLYCFDGYGQHINLEVNQSKKIIEENKKKNRRRKKKED